MSDIKFTWETLKIQSLSKYVPRGRNQTTIIYTEIFEIWLIWEAGFSFKKLKTWLAEEVLPGAENHASAASGACS